MVENYPGKLPPGGNYSQMPDGREQTKPRDNEKKEKY